MDEAENRDFKELVAAVRDTLNLRLDGYRSKQLLRRLGFFRQRHGAANNAELARRLRVDRTLQAQFSEFLTINVSEFLRNPERFDDLRDRYLPALLQNRPVLNVWSAGCASGAELYSVAFLLAELTPGPLHRLLGTDIDATSLARATYGIYQAGEIQNVPDLVRKRYLIETDTGWEVSPEIRRRTTFQRHDLLRDQYPENQDLILCRNVVIYFTEEAKHEIYRKLTDSLRAGGLLFIGATETIFDARSLGLIYTGPCMYTKPQTAVTGRFTGRGRQG